MTNNRAAPGAPVNSNALTRVRTHEPLGFLCGSRDGQVFTLKAAPSSGIAVGAALSC